MANLLYSLMKMSSQMLSEIIEFFNRDVGKNFTQQNCILDYVTIYLYMFDEQMKDKSPAM